MSQDYNVFENGKVYSENKHVGYVSANGAMSSFRGEHLGYYKRKLDNRDVFLSNK